MKKMMGCWLEEVISNKKDYNVERFDKDKKMRLFGGIYLQIN